MAGATKDGGEGDVVVLLVVWLLDMALFDLKWEALEEELSKLSNLLSHLDTHDFLAAFDLSDRVARC